MHRPDGTTVSGTLIDDFGDYLLPANRLGRTWAPPQRWAIALKSGTLIFADDQDITTAPAPIDSDTSTDGDGDGDGPDVRAVGAGTL